MKVASVLKRFRAGLLIFVAGPPTGLLITIMGSPRPRQDGNCTILDQLDILSSDLLIHLALSYGLAACKR